MKGWLLFFLGGALGGITGYLVGKKSVEKTVDLQIEEMRNYYEEQLAEAGLRTKISDMMDNADDTNTGREEGALSGDERTRLRDAMKDAKKEMVDYTKMYNKEEEEVDDSDIPDAVYEHEQNFHRPPEMIAEELTGEIPDWVEQQILYYFAYDETLCTEDYEVIFDLKPLVGDVFEESGFIDDDTSSIFVRNYQTDALYEVVKKQASYEDYIMEGEK